MSDLDDLLSRAAEDAAAICADCVRPGDLPTLLDARPSGRALCERCDRRRAVSFVLRPARPTPAHSAEYRGLGADRDYFARTAFKVDLAANRRKAEAAPVPDSLPPGLLCSARLP